MLVHKFFCRVPTCPQSVFTERLPEFLQPSSRLTARLRSLIQAIGLAFNGQGGARLSKQCGVQISRVTLLRSLQLFPESAGRQVRMVGVDDFAWKRGKQYGTVIIELETHDVLDLLPDREAESVKRWLAAHPEIEIVRRDRGGAYADGAAQGAPQAEQVADRWHICKNLGDALEQAIQRLQISVPTEPSGEPPSSNKRSVPPVPEAKPSARTLHSQATLQRKQEQAEWIKELYASGHSIHAVASQPGLARNTVRRYLRMDGEVQIAPRPRGKSLLDPHYDYLHTRWKQGETNARRLFEEVRERGYRGGEATVRSFVARLRKDLPGMVRPPRKTAGGHTPAASPRELRWLLARREQELEPEERADLARLLAHSPEATLLHQFVQDFLRMLREQQFKLLDARSSQQSDERDDQFCRGD
ncbi:MAG TPA: ISL3 family transposase [Ktedonobacteraceae bacterium]|nr:ISL3 family transposase [Ktedonobacteraceae bacterium]